MGATDEKGVQWCPHPPFADLVVTMVDIDSELYVLLVPSPQGMTRNARGEILS